MSQVIVSKDGLSKEREHAFQEEQRIDIHRMSRSWTITSWQPNFLQKIIGLAMLPVFLLWGLLFFLLTVMVGTSLWILFWVFRKLST